MTDTLDHAPALTVASSHLADLGQALDRFGDAADTAVRWGHRLAESLLAGGRLLAAGNGGSAAQAQHFTAEVVGRYRADRPPFSAVALHTEPCALTAIANDYGIEQMFARQVAAHGRPGDVCVLMSTSGGSSNILAAARRARLEGITVWAMTGRTPNALAEVADDVLSVDAATTATVQELHLVAVHLICDAFDQHLAALPVASPGIR